MRVVYSQRGRQGDGLLSDIFKEDEILQKLNNSIAIPNADVFLEYDMRSQIDLMSTAKIKDADLIFGDLIGVEGWEISQKEFEKRMRGYLNEKGVVGYNLVKTILINQDLGEGVFMYFINSRIQRIAHFNKYIIKNPSLAEGLLGLVYKKIKVHKKFKNKMKIFKRLDFQNQRELEAGLRGMSIRAFFENLKDEDKELFISYISLNRSLNEFSARGVLDSLGEGSGWFQLLLIKFKVNESPALTPALLKYLLKTKDINNLEPVYRSIPRAWITPDLLAKVSDPGRLASLVGRLDRAVFESIDHSNMFSDSEDVMCFLRGVPEMDQEVYVEILNMLKDRLVGGDYLEPEVLLGRDIVDSNVLNALYSLDVDRVNRYLASCSATPDDILLELLQKGYDEERIMDNLKNRDLPSVIKKVFLV